MCPYLLAANEHSSAPSPGCHSLAGARLPAPASSSDALRIDLLPAAARRPRNMDRADCRTTFHLLDSRGHFAAHECMDSVAGATRRQPVN